MSKVSGNQIMSDKMMAAFIDLAADKNTELHPDLKPYLEDGEWGPMLRHPLVYSIPLTLPGLANRQYEHKRECLTEAINDGDWSRVIWLHERAYRLEALIDYVTGRDDEGDVLSLAYSDQWARELAADVWVDSENIEQKIDDWRALFDNGDVPMLGTQEEQAAFSLLPRCSGYPDDDPHIQAWRGGSVGDWSWTTDYKIAKFFARRSGLNVRGHHIPVSDVFGYLTRRGEAELLVKFTEFRRSLVYPVSGNRDTL